MKRSHFRFEIDIAAANAENEGPTLLTLLRNL